MDTIEENFPHPLTNIFTLLRNDDVIIARLDKLDKNVEDIKREKSSIHILGVTEGYWTKVQELITERQHKDHKVIGTEYRPHLTKILRLPIRTLGLYDPTGDDSFLSTNTDILPIKLSGTTDLVIVDRYSIASQAQKKHIRVLFELKKAVNKEHTFRTMAELISADLKSIHPVLAVLTDLIDDWLDKRRINKLESSGPTPATQESTEMDTTELTNKSSGLAQTTQESTEMNIASSTSEEPLPKRQKLRHVITTSNVSSDVVPMEDFYDTMSEEEIFIYKAKQILTQFFSQPIFDGLDDQKNLDYNDTKKANDEVKLWRETLDGISLVNLVCRPLSNQFEIVGVQVAGEYIYIEYSGK
ncbi:8525_t:CDS:2 [Acaulospora morrowiae]|uniref:8525_t:CDS:1 n=1 Tax=Acaulospora morrowiae TaxID=94023 RepID=A0A9N9G862_9GLOM|nr:8525_t:CDS:2 [Acaulospora morrowiae]